MARKIKKKRKIKLKSILIFAIIVTAILFGLACLSELKISNIVIKGNTLYTDWEIIEKAGLENYPSTFENSSGTIAKRLEDDSYIKDVTVRKEWFTKVIIEVKENLPLFYYLPSQKTILMDKTETTDNFPVPTVINYVPDKLYEQLIEKLGNVNYEIVKRISEITYDPNEVDEERFLLLMNDSNYVYLTLATFDKIDKYLDIIKEFDNKKGTLYLDSGEYFEIRE